ncbi:MAG: dTDP-4-dehydrorhamnose 3,5-epimerase [Candidatus Micrarchaeota archaeon]
MDIEGIQIIDTPLQGAFLIKPKEFHDLRGDFYKTFTRRALEAKGVKPYFAEEFFSLSKRGVVRGLHFQTGALAQGKLVSCSKGEIFDVIVDMREGSVTYGRWISNILDEGGRVSLYVPRGFAHGFMALSAEAETFYKADNDYSPAHEGGIRWDDPALGIRWPDVGKVIVSEKDAGWPAFSLSRKER